MSLEKIPNSAALRLQLACIIGHEPAGSFVEIRPLHPDGRVAVDHREFVPVGAAFQRVPELVDQLASTMNIFVGVCPRIRREGTAEAVQRAWCLWVDLDSNEALGKLGAFDPQPSIVICSGSGGAHSYWPLKSPLEPAVAQRYNRRLVLALGGDPAATDPARILRPAGSWNHKPSPLRPVICSRLELDVYAAADVVAQLPDDPRYLPLERPRRKFGPKGADGMQGVVKVVKNAPEGNRNASVFWATCRIGEETSAGSAEERRAIEEIRAAALEVGLTEQEIAATIRSGLRQRGAA